MTSEEVFTSIYKSNFWRGTESPCGGGSTLAHCLDLSSFLEGLISTGRIKSLLDVGCGDVHWISRVRGINSISYLGVDVVDFSEQVQEKIPTGKFLKQDLSESALGAKYDLVLCKDVLMHLPLQKGRKLLDVLRSVAPKYLLLTTHLDGDNRDIQEGQWYHINMMSGPFNLPKPTLFFPRLPLGAWRNE